MEVENDKFDNEFDEYSSLTASRILTHVVICFFFPFIRHCGTCSFRWGSCFALLLVNCRSPVKKTSVGSPVFRVHNN